MRFKHHHVSLSVKNIAASINFYRYFGYEKIFDSYLEKRRCQLVHLKMANTIIELFCFDTPAQQNRSADLAEDLQRGGIRHFAFEVDDIKAAQAWVKKQLSQSVEVHSGASVDYLFIRDPDGNFVEIVEDNRFK